MARRKPPLWGDGRKPDFPPKYDDTEDFSKYLYNRGHAPVPHNKHDHRPIDTEPHEMTYWEERIAALTRLLVEKGVVTLDEMRRAGEEVEAQDVTVGAKVIARAWVDPEFKKRLLENATKTCQEFGVQMEDSAQPTEVVAYEQTDDVHWVVVCTLCSCYPRPLLGQPPHWYKSTAYRNRVVVDPRGVLKDEFGTVVPENVEVRVIDSTADTRFLIIPKRPPGTEGMSEEELAELVTCESVTGVAHAKTPGQAVG
jgi:nitrile hydratase